MEYGKVSIEKEQVYFKKRMIDNSLPCRDILWAYRRKEYIKEENGQFLTGSSVVIYTKRKKRYQFDMEDGQAKDFLERIHQESPMTVLGYPTVSRLNLESLSNTRDIGTLINRNGKLLLPGKFLRSGELYHLSSADEEYLRNRYHLRLVIDFRSEWEQQKKPDSFIRDVKYVKNPLFYEEPLFFRGYRDLSFLRKIMNYEGDIEAEIRQRYRNLVLDDLCVKHYAEFFDLLLNFKEGTVLWHCSDGKDRTGIGTALLLSALEMPYYAIQSDYLRSNQYEQEEERWILHYLKERQEISPQAEQRLHMLFHVKEHYLREVFQTIEKEYGTTENFLRRKMYLTPKVLEELRNKFLV